MPAINSYYGFYRAYFTDRSLNRTLTAAESGTIDGVIVPRNSNWTVFVQRIILNVTTDAAETLTFQDGAGTPVVIGASPVSPGIGAFVVADFGSKGKNLTEGEELDIVISGAGLAGQINIEAYERLTAVTTTAGA